MNEAKQNKVIFERFKCFSVQICILGKIPLAAVGSLYPVLALFESKKHINCGLVQNALVYLKPPIYIYLLVLCDVSIDNIFIK